VVAAHLPLAISHGNVQVRALWGDRAR
jgi:hypothetical protein